MTCTKKLVSEYKALKADRDSLREQLAKTNDLAQSFWQKQMDRDWPLVQENIALKADRDRLREKVQAVLDETWILTAHDRDRWQTKLREALARAMPKDSKPGDGV